MSSYPSSGIPFGVRCIRAGYGYYTFEVSSYSAFIHEVAPAFVANEYGGERQTFIWRGMRDPAWTLQSSLSRFASQHVKSNWPMWQRTVSRMTTGHLIEFMKNTRGLDCLNREHDQLYVELLRHSHESYWSFLDVLTQLSDEQQNLVHELFSFGQHDGLLTPFLDWTAIPLIALYFAFCEPDQRADGVGDRVVFALNRSAVEAHCPQGFTAGADGILLKESMAHANPRIVPQAGLFTFVPAHLPVDQWVVSTAKRAGMADFPVLIRFLIRNGSRSECMNELASCGIHARTIFPDRFGAALNSNFRLEPVSAGVQQR